MQEGIALAFAAVNARAAPGEPLFELVARDDGYEPERALDNVQDLIGDPDMLALLGTVGTPTTVAVTGMATHANLAILAPLTGAGELRTPAARSVLNVRASYAQEAERLIAWFVDEQGMDRIAVLFQDDGFGQAGLAGVRAALRDRGLQPSAIASYTRNTRAVKMPLFEISRVNPEAIVVVGAHVPTTEAVLWADKLGVRADFAALSFVGAQLLARALAGARPEGSVRLYVPRVVPAPPHPLFQAFLEDAAGTDADVESATVFEGYLAGRVAVELVRGLDGPPTRAALYQHVLSGPRVSVAGVTLSFGPDDNQAFDAVELLRILPDGSFAPAADRAE